MIERDFVLRKKKEFQIQEFIKSSLKGVGLSGINIQRTPLGEKIIINASRPGLVIGSGGSNIKELTRDLKKEFELENPQIEINEVQNDNLVASIVAERIAYALERFGPMRFKGIGHRTKTDVLNAGAKGIEILIAGKIPSARARVWRFYEGYIKKCGESARSHVNTAYEIAQLKSGVVGIKVSIMPPDVRLPDDVQFIKQVEEVEEVKKEEAKGIEEEIKKETEQKVVEKKKESKEKDKKESKEGKEKNKKKSSKSKK